jgi:hypothetical protein
MQTKTIKKTIVNKLEDWLQSIKDEQLRKNVKENLLVSGGSICSLFLNEQVNDYDIYFQNIEVLKQLIHYYTKDYDNITILDGREKDTTYSQDQYRDGILGASVRNLKLNQIKLFFENKNGGTRVNEDKDLNLEENKYIPLFFSPNAISLSHDIQIVTRFSGTPEEIHQTFDFVHATNYFTFKDGVVTNLKALESLLSKQLFYQSSMYPVTSIIRIKKFLKRNWNITAGEMLKIMFDISELDLKNIDVLEEQLIGVDVAYFGTLIEALRNKIMKPEEKFTMNAQYLKALIDKIFNEDDTTS